MLCKLHDRTMADAGARERGPGGARMKRLHRSPMWVKKLIIPVLLLLSAADFSHAQSDYRYTPASKDPSKLSTVIGRMREHTSSASARVRSTSI